MTLPAIEPEDNITPVLAVSIHVPTYFLATLSYPLQRMPKNGCPIKAPPSATPPQHFPRPHFFPAVPADSSGGLDGSIHIFTFASNLPTNGSSFLCASPGVAAFCMASIMAF